MTTETVDEGKLHAFLGKVIGDMGAALSAGHVVLGDRLGLYKALAESGAMTAVELGERLGLSVRYVSEWLNNQAAGGYLIYDASSGRYTLPPEHAMALADESSPVFLPGAFELILASLKAQPRVEECFRHGGGIAWGEQDPGVFSGTERFFRPSYRAHLVASWLPALDGVVSKLQAGAVVADVGCGAGASTLLMAQAFPHSTFVGFDYHTGSVELARSRAQEAGVHNVRFETATMTDFPGRYDLVAHFDCLHDTADPEGAARQVLKALKPDGTWLIVEPFAHDDAKDNHTPLGRVMYAASTLLCVPCSLAGNGPALGAQAGEARIGGVVRAGGFSRFRRASETPFNLIYEARP